MNERTTPDPHRSPSTPDDGVRAATPDADPGAWIDYSAEMRVHRNPALRWTFRALGLTALAFGVVGAFVPGLPTTVWILVATFFFARSSPRFYNWVLNHPWFGRLVRDFRAGLGVPLWVKVLAIGMIVLFAGTAAIALIGILWVRLLVAAVGLAGIVYLLAQPTRRLDPAIDGRTLRSTALRALTALVGGAALAVLLRGLPTAAFLAAGTGALIALSSAFIPLRR